MRHNLSLFVLLITMLIMYVETWKHVRKNIPPNQIRRKPDIKYIDYINPLSVEKNELVLKEILNPLKSKRFKLERTLNYLLDSVIQKLFYKSIDPIDIFDEDANLRAMPYKPMVKKTKNRDHRGMIVVSDNNARYKVLPQGY